MGNGGETPRPGLFMARMIARFHGGDLHAENVPGAVRFRAMLRVVS